jgi:hypothetical protein
VTRPLVFLDTETDGLTPNRRIWEIAIIRRDPDGSETEWSAFIDIDLRKADLKGLYVGRFYDRHPKGRWLAGTATEQTYAVDSPTAHLVKQETAARTIARLTHGATIVGAVPNFDTEAISKLLRTHGITPAWHHRLRCVETLAAGYTGQDLGGLRACADELGIAPWDEHTALGDTRAAKDVYDAIMTREALAE